MQNLNVVALTGNLTRDLELRHTPSGTAVTTIRIAVNDRVKRGDEWVDAAYYFDITVWGRNAENCCQYLSKGKPIAVNGKLTWREWEAQDGSKRQSVEITADNVQFLNSGQGQGQGQGGGGGGGQDGGGGQQQSAASSEPDFVPSAEAAVDDDIPF